MKRLYLTGILWAVFAHAHIRAQESVQPPPGTGRPDASPAPVSNLGGENLPLNAQQVAGVQITQQWEDKSLEAMEAQPGQDGAIVFKYGRAMPSIVCAPFHLTDIALEVGENGNDKPLIGDPKRWFMQTSVEGNPDDPQQRREHVIVKPNEIGLDTTLVILTDRRTYHLRLVSHQDKFMANVAFSYPDDPAPKPVAAPPPAVAEDPPSPKAPRATVALADPAPRHKKKVHLEEGKGVIETAKHEGVYRIRGNAPWRPLSVYHDGRKTYIELPPGRQETPVLFAVKKGGFLGMGHTAAQCNFRVHGDWLVADAVLDKAALTSGVGSSKQEVKIERLDR